MGWMPTQSGQIRRKQRSIPNPVAIMRGVPAIVINSSMVMFMPQLPGVFFYFSTETIYPFKVKKLKNMIKILLDKFIRN